MLRLLEHRADDVPARSLGSPAVQGFFSTALSPYGARGQARAALRPSSATVDLPEPLAPVSTTASPSRAAARSKGAATACVRLRVAVGHLLGSDHHGPTGRAAYDGAQAGRRPGSQTPCTAGVSPYQAQTLAGDPSSDDAAAGSQHDDPVDQWQRLLHPVLDQDRGRPASRASTADKRRPARESAPAGSRLAVGSSSSSSRGLRASTPAMARRCFSPPDRSEVERSQLVRETHRDCSDSLYPRPDLVSRREGPVLQAERDVVTRPSP